MTPTFRDAFAEAGRLGHQWAGPEHLLLALLRDDRPSTARTVLHELGLSHAEAERRLVASLTDAEPPLRSTVANGRHVTASPATYRLEGWVEGFAAVAGTEPTPEHALVGLRWNFAERLHGVTSAAVLAALVERGVPVPAGGQPAEPQPRDERVDVSPAQLGAVRQALLAADRLIGFNVDPDDDTAWVVIEAGDADARALVAATIGGAPTG